MSIYGILRKFPNDVLADLDGEWAERADSLAKTIAVLQAALKRDQILANADEMRSPVQPDDINHDTAVLAFLKANNAPKDMIVKQNPRTEPYELTGGRVGSDIDLDGLLDDMKRLAELKAQQDFIDDLLTTLRAILELSET